MEGLFLAIDNDEQILYEDIDELLFQTSSEDEKTSPPPESNVKPSETRKRVNICDKTGKKKYNHRIISTTGAQIIHLTDDSLLNQPRRKHMKKRPTAAEHFENIDEWKRIMSMIIQDGRVDEYNKEMEKRGLKMPIPYRYLHSDPQLTKSIQSRMNEQHRLDVLVYAAVRLEVAQIFN